MMGGVLVSGETNVIINCGETVVLPIIEYRNTNKYFVGWYTDEDCTNIWDESVSVVYDDITLYAKWGDYYDNDSLVLPKIYIDTGGTARIQKGIYTTVTVTMTNSDEDFTNISAQICGRGNSTWSEFEKKPYRLNFDKKIDLFGMGARKSWVLLANAMDHSLTRGALGGADAAVRQKDKQNVQVIV